MDGPKVRRNGFARRIPREPWLYRFLGVVCGAFWLALTPALAFSDESSGLSAYAWIGGLLTSFAVVIILVLKSGFRGGRHWNAMTEVMSVFALLGGYIALDLAGGLLVLWVGLSGEAAAGPTISIAVFLLPIGILAILVALLAHVPARYREMSVSGVRRRFSDAETAIRNALEANGQAYDYVRDDSLWKLPGATFSLGGGAWIRVIDGWPFGTGLKKRVRHGASVLVSAQVDAAIDRNLGLSTSAAGA